MEECGFLSQKKVIKEEPLIIEPVGHRENIQNKQLKFFILNPVIFLGFFSNSLTTRISEQYIRITVSITGGKN